MTATPHSGKEADFQLFMALLDGDRFEGRFREGVHTADVSDLLRRLTKEELKTFDGRPLFPERRAYTVNYQLSADEAALYDGVTEYVREEMNRADRLASIISSMPSAPVAKAAPSSLPASVNIATAKACRSASLPALCNASATSRMAVSWSRTVLSCSNNTGSKCSS